MILNCGKEAKSLQTLFSSVETQRRQKRHFSRPGHSNLNVSSFSVASKNQFCVDFFTSEEKLNADFESKVMFQ